MWWRTVHIGSLTMSSWSAVQETVSLRQVQGIFQTTSSAYLVVVESLDPLKIVGVIFQEAAEKIIAASTDDQSVFLQQPIVQVKGLVSTNFHLMPISGGVIRDLEEQFEKGCISVILYRSTHDLSVTASNNNQEIGAKERKHVIAVVTEGDLKRWIDVVEKHHNMS